MGISNSKQQQHKQQLQLKRDTIRLQYELKQQEDEERRKALEKYGMFTKIYIYKKKRRQKRNEAKMIYFS